MKKYLIAALAAFTLPAMAQTVIPISNESFESPPTTSKFNGASNWGQILGTDRRAFAGVINVATYPTGCSNKADLLANEINGDQLAELARPGDGLYHDMFLPEGGYKLHYKSIDFRCLGLTPSGATMRVLSSSGSVITGQSFATTSGQVNEYTLEFDLPTGTTVRFQADHLTPGTAIPTNFEITGLELTPIVNPAEPIACYGLLPPLASGPVKAKKGRAIPVKIEAEIPVDAAPPVVNIYYVGDGSAEPVEVELVSLGAASDGNQMVSDDGVNWQLNATTKNYTAEGGYLINVVAGDDTYFLDGCTSGEFIK